jgi:pilus assembly protein Flp/PilA
MENSNFVRDSSHAWGNAMSPIRRFLTDSDGTTAVEYAVLLAMILLSVIGSIGAFGGAAGGVFGHSESELRAAFGN